MVDALSKIINMMRDLHQLAEQRKIKSKLYSGDGLERIDRMIGDSRITRWLSTICEVEYNDKQTWHHLIKFLERDLKVQQQKLLIQNKSENKRQKQTYKEKWHVGRYNSHFTASSSMEPKCCICKEAEEHIATNGPKGTKIVQYFACEKLLEMVPKDRFQKLKNKCYCFQCLFPGASQDKGKHHYLMCKEILCVTTNHMTSIL